MLQKNAPQLDLLLCLCIMLLVSSSCGFAKRDVILKTPYDTDTIKHTYIQSNMLAAGNYYNIIKAEDELAIADLQDITILVRKEHDINDLKTDTYATFKVNAAGEVNLPLIGKVVVAGLNRDQAARHIESKYSEKELKRPLIDLRIINMYIVIMGEIAKPGKYMIDREDVELVDLLGEAGGLTALANKRMVKIIRGDRANPETILINLDNYGFLKDPNLRLRSRDIIYVEPRSGAVRARNAQGYTTFFQIGLVALNTILLIVNLSK